MKQHKVRGTEKGQQSRRIIFILHKLYSGHKYTTTELKQLVEEEFGQVSLRTVQRDLQIMGDCDSMIDSSNKNGRESVWRIHKFGRTSGNVKFLDSNQILSLYFLKAHLRTFKGTIIEEQANILFEKLEDFAPSDVIEAESLYWDKNIGQYDYTYDDPNLRRVIIYISRDKWVKIEYKPQGAGEAHIIEAKLRSIVTYAGYLYVIAYIPKHDSHVALSIHRIITIEEFKSDIDIKVPEFNYHKFTKDRFGVYDGDIFHVRLIIKPDYAHFFEKRMWHQSQKITYDSDRNMIIELDVPIAPDLISWIMSWGPVIKVESPQELADKIKRQANEIITIYK